MAAKALAARLSRCPLFSPGALQIGSLRRGGQWRKYYRGIPTKKGFDRDEYPPAMSDEGGKGADVRYVRRAENLAPAP